MDDLKKPNRVEHVLNYINLAKNIIKNILPVLNAVYNLICALAKHSGM